MLKLAINEKGLEQNTTEADYGLDQMYPGVINVALNDCEKGNWVVAKKLKPVSKKEIADYYGVSWDGLTSYFEKMSKHAMHRAPRPDIPEVHTGPREDPMALDRIERLNLFLSDCDILTSDFTKTNSFGRDPDTGNILLIDFGLTRDIWAAHYAGRNTSLSRDVR